MKFGGRNPEYSGEFFTIAQLEAFDTLAVLDYLEQFSQIRVNSFLTDSESFLDSVSNEQPALIVKIDDLESSQSNAYTFYVTRLTPETRIFVIGNDRQVGVITEEKFKVIAKDLSFFSLKER